MKFVKPLTLIAFYFTCTKGIAQIEYGKGQVDISVGVGFGSVLNQTIDETGASDVAKFKTQGIPFNVGVDYGITSNISLGLVVNHTKAKYVAYGEDVEHDQFLTIGIRGLYHFSSINKLDAYAGGMIGATAYKAEDPAGFYKPEKKTLFTYQATVGARYTFSKPLGIFAELGYGVTIFNVGLNLKF